MHEIQCTDWNGSFFFHYCRFIFFSCPYNEAQYGFHRFNLWLVSTFSNPLSLFASLTLYNRVFFVHFLIRLDTVVHFLFPEYRINWPRSIKLKLIIEIGASPVYRRCSQAQYNSFECIEFGLNMFVYSILVMVAVSFELCTLLNPLCLTASFLLNASGRYATISVEITTKAAKNHMNAFYAGTRLARNPLLWKSTEIFVKILVLNWKLLTSMYDNSNVTRIKRFTVRVLVVHGLTNAMNTQFQHMLLIHRCTIYSLSGYNCRTIKQN